MKVRMSKPWERLPPSQRKTIAEEMQNILLKQEDKDMRIMFDLYIKMVCVVLHDAFGFGEKRLTMFLGNHKRLFHRQHKMVKDGSQIEYLDRRMAEIFKKNGFPQGFFDNMLGEVGVTNRRVDDEQREED